MYCAEHIVLCTTADIYFNRRISFFICPYIVFILLILSQVQEHFKFRFREAALIDNYNNFAYPSFHCLIGTFKIRKESVHEYVITSFNHRNLYNYQTRYSLFRIKLCIEMVHLCIIKLNNNNDNKTLDIYNIIPFYSFCQES
jgi:hypothetical protein